MAGSFKHVTTKTGKLAKPEKVLAMLETASGDVYEAVEEMYGMIWVLATELAGESFGSGANPVAIIEHARLEYAEGLLAAKNELKGKK